MEEPDNVEAETTVSGTEMESVVAEEEITPTVDSLEGLTAKCEAQESAIDALIERVSDLVIEVRSHAEHLPVRGTSSPRRHNTYEVKKDGESVVKIAKSELGSSGRYVEILALNGITLDNALKEGEILELPIQ